MYQSLFPSTSRIRSQTPAWEALSVVGNGVDEGSIEVEWLPMDEFIVMESDAELVAPMIV